MNEIQIVTKNVRLQQWSSIIKDCKSIGLKVDDYCSEHNISRNSYYWLRKIKEATLEQSGNIFAELNRPFAVSAPADLRRGIDGIAAIVQYEFDLAPTIDESGIFLFCGQRTDSIKVLIYEGDGFVLLYKRLADGKFQRPRSESEVKDLTIKQYRCLMDGLKIEQKSVIKQTKITQML